MESTENDALITALQNPALYPHPVRYFKVLQTHLSWVILTGDYAYKIKKPLNLGFADFSTKEKRRHFCEQELMLNQLLAPNLYLAVIPITGTKKVPHFDKENKSPVVDYCIQMREFPQTALLGNRITKQTLDAFIIQDMAKKIAHFHTTTEVLPANSRFGTPENILDPILANFRECKKNILEPEILEKLLSIENWTHTTFEKLKPLFQTRKEWGFIRDCHGDLHLNNMVLWENAIIVFDRIDFNEDFRCIDTMNEIAFLIMDCEAKNHPDIANQFLNDYLAITNDYQGLPLLTFYKVYRAMVRAKIALLSGFSEKEPEFTTYLNLAYAYLKMPKPVLLILHGPSGSGKTTLAKKLCPDYAAILIRSDIERKRLNPKPNYSEQENSATYATLATLTETLLKNGYSVIVDATFLRYSQRQIMTLLAKAAHVPFAILHCITSEKLLKKRILKRKKMGGDPSDANESVVNRQLEKQEAIKQEELPYTVSIETDTSLISCVSAIGDVFRQQNGNAGS